MTTTQDLTPRQAAALEAITANPGLTPWEIGEIVGHAYLMPTLRQLHKKGLARHEDFSVLSPWFAEVAR